MPGLPEDMLIVLPVRNMVLFPGVVLPVAIKREKTVAGAQEAVRTERKVGFLLQKDPDNRRPRLRRPAPRSARSRASCATSPPRTARTTSSARASGASACSTPWAASRTWSRASST
jgi:hypothetical protein